MTSNLEIAANAVTAVSIFLAGRNSVHTWWIGIIGCALFGWLFYDAKLFADGALQVFFVGSSIVGLRQWLHGADGEALPITNVTWQHLGIIAAASAVVTAAYGSMLHFYTSAYAPFWDSAVLVLSVVAQLLMMQRRIENWWFWLVVNSIAVPLYASRGLTLTAVLYSFYWINAIVSWLWWRRLQAAPVPA